VAHDKKHAELLEHYASNDRTSGDYRLSQECGQLQITQADDQSSQ
jgi:hypothetical protein